MFQRLRSMLGRGQANDSEHFRQVDEALSDLAEHVTEKLSVAEKLIKDQNSHFTTVTAGFVTQEKFDELKALLDKTPRSFSALKPATGTDDTLRADC
ncbi:Phage capsid scaffolding protein (GPO) serine peptidase [compost metagenome]